MVACDQGMAPSAPNSGLQAACETLVLPATTAAPGAGDRKVPGGITISIGFRHPSLSGMSVPTRHRNTIKHDRARDSPAAR